MLVAIATAPAMMCLSYVAQNSEHGCCPEKTSPATVTPSCCFHAFAITSHSIDGPAPMTAEAPMTAGELAISITNADPIVVADLDTSPPHGSSILRI